MRAVIAAASAAGLTAVVGGGVALAQPHETSHAAPAVRTFHLVAHQTSEHSLDFGKKGFSSGDEDLSAARLTSGGKHVGRFYGVCQAVAVARTATELCTQSFRLPHGTVDAAGAVTSSQSGPGPFDWAITGGTGTYEKARGIVHVIPGNRTVHMTLRITR